MSILDKIKTKVAEKVAEDLAEKAERGEFGPVAQTIYVRTKGAKTEIGLVLFLLSSAVLEFAPPWASEATRYLALASMGLTAIGVLDRARRSAPIFEPWFLEAFGRINDWIAAVSAVWLAFAQEGLLKLLFPAHADLADTVNLILAAVTVSTAFIGRLAKASAAQPKTDPKENQ